MIPTRFFLFEGKGTTYYALIKANDCGFAFEVYDNEVMTIESKEDEEQLLSSVKEISLSEAIEEMKRLVSEDEKQIADREILEQLSNDELYLLGIDRRLV